MYGLIFKHKNVKYTDSTIEAIWNQIVLFVFDKYYLVMSGCPAMKTYLRLLRTEVTFKRQTMADFSEISFVLIEKLKTLFDFIFNVLR